jgi:hypothetical protein
MANPQRLQIQALEKVAILAAELLLFIYKNVRVSDMPDDFVYATEELSDGLAQLPFYSTRDFTAALAMEEARARLAREAGEVSG